MTAPAKSKCTCRAGFEGTGKKCKKKQCHPLCRWDCDDPRTPAVCQVFCHRPKCAMQCSTPACPKCWTHCEAPHCAVRCPSDAFECHAKQGIGSALEGCPQCETVCAPSKCETRCEAPPPAECKPKCEENPCAWKCKRPTTIARPKCVLRCDKPVCSIRKVKAKKSKLGKKHRTHRHHRSARPSSSAAGAKPQKCCKCTANNIGAAMRFATEQHRADAQAVAEADAQGTTPAPQLPSLLEVMAEVNIAAEAAEAAGVEESEVSGICCPC